MPLAILVIRGSWARMGWVFFRSSLCNNVNLCCIAMHWLKWQTNLQSLEDTQVRQALVRKSLGPINQPPWPTLLPNWIFLLAYIMPFLLLFCVTFFFFFFACLVFSSSFLSATMLVTLSTFMSATTSNLHVSHRNVVSALCEVSETLTEWKSETITGGRAQWL